MTEIPRRAVDLTHPDVVQLVGYVAELEREVANARRYLQDCRDAVEAEDGEMLLDAIRRRRPPGAITRPSHPS